MKRNIIKVLAMLLLSIFWVLGCSAQSDSEHYFDEVAIKIGFGGDRWSFTPWDNARIGYMTTSLSGYFAKEFYHEGNVTSSYFYEPIYQQALSDNFEAGVNVGVQYRYKFNEQFSGFGFFGIGPHYASILTQATPSSNGFTIELVFGAGAYYFLSDRDAISFSANLTHNSNGRFFFPNYMNNDLYGEIGYSVFYN